MALRGANSSPSTADMPNSPTAGGSGCKFGPDAVPGQLMFGQNKSKQPFCCPLQASLSVDSLKKLDASCFCFLNQVLTSSAMSELLANSSEVLRPEVVTLANVLAALAAAVAVFSDALLQWRGFRGKTASTGCGTHELVVQAWLCFPRAWCCCFSSCCCSEDPDKLWASSSFPGVTRYYQAQQSVKLLHMLLVAAANAGLLSGSILVAKFLAFDSPDAEHDVFVAAQLVGFGVATRSFLALVINYSLPEDTALQQSLDSAEKLFASTEYCYGLTLMNVLAKHLASPLDDGEAVRHWRTQAGPRVKLVRAWLELFMLRKLPTEVSAWPSSKSASAQGTVEENWENLMRWQCLQMGLGAAAAVFGSPTKPRSTRAVAPDLSAQCKAVTGNLHVVFGPGSKPWDSSKDRSKAHFRYVPSLPALKRLDAALRTCDFVNDRNKWTSQGKSLVDQRSLVIIVRLTLVPVVDLCEQIASLKEVAQTNRIMTILPKDDDELATMLSGPTAALAEMKRCSEVVGLLLSTLKTMAKAAGLFAPEGAGGWKAVDADARKATTALGVSKLLSGKADFIKNLMELSPLQHRTVLMSRCGVLDKMLSAPPDGGLVAELNRAPAGPAVLPGTPDADAKEA